MIPIVDGLSIPDEDISFQVSRSGGPGGQNVNKVSSRVTLRFNVEDSKALTAEQRRRIQRKLAGRISKEGFLQVTSQRTRSQEMNRADAVERFAQLLRDALHRETPRIKTSATTSSKEERLKGKKRRTQIKVERSRRDWDQ